MKPVILEFDNGKYKSTYNQVTILSTSWIYVWIESKSKLAVYVGETSQNLLKRLRHSIGECPHNSLEQLKNNAEITGLDISQKFMVYAYPVTYEKRLLGLLTLSFKQQCQSIESWVHWLICVKLKKHHDQYCGFKYNLPIREDKKSAKLIVEDLAKQCGWINVSL